MNSSALPSRARSLHRSVALLLISLLLLVLAATAAWAQQVTIDADGASPDPLTIQAGEQVEFVNAGDADVRMVDDGGRWDSGVLKPGDTFAITLEEEGRVTYAAEDGSAAGVVIVTAADAVMEDLPNTGLPLVMLASLAVAGLGGGTLLLRRTR